MEISLRGIGVSPGIAIGPVLPFGLTGLEVPKYQVEDKEAELRRFHDAMECVRVDLQRLHQKTAQDLGPKHAEIFEAHLMVLDDVTFHEEIEKRLRTEGWNVEQLVEEFIGRYSQMLDSVDDAKFRERTQDVVDVLRRIQGRLLKAEMESLEHLEHPCVVVAHDLSPSDTAKMDLENTLGVVTDLSGPTSHTAILARAFEIPAVVALGTVGTQALAGDTVIVDGGHGDVILRPTETTLGRYVAEKKRLEEERQALLMAEKDIRSVTLDGFEIPTMANIELPVEISHSKTTKAQGIGLYRTEYLFMNRASLPSEQEQFDAYATVAEAMNPASVTLRTLDLGGDKFVSHLQLADEINPQLGWRAIRFCLERPDIFKAQLRAMFRASVHGNVRIMFPLVSGLDEFRRVKNMVQEVRADLERRGVPFDPNVQIGTMIEVPSAVVIADLLAAESDFFSIGTNDLIQYGLAVDRANEKIAHMYEPAHPAVLRLIRQVVRAARAARIPCGLCGEMAGDPVFTEILVGLGIDSLSMSAVAIPVVRVEVANIRMRVARRFARRVLKMGSESAIKKLLYKRYKSRHTLSRVLGRQNNNE
ncbi:MAG TPA: phosphoenolpyruvate--protein phosphotransferase [Candidatus Hydrogenedentes bacterium]|nr:phosphoenolpyruvate--protein phosphotransferase [Candidatus Hydrogenedentota bacterium]HQM49604.1 phosphoenolpyruvate--protein phosphotransferase [Candidatus Hydrogenedentota bacterium]